MSLNCLVLLNSSTVLANDDPNANLNNSVTNVNNDNPKIDKLLPVTDQVNPQNNIKDGNSADDHNISVQDQNSSQILPLSGEVNKQGVLNNSNNLTLSKESPELNQFDRKKFLLNANINSELINKYVLPLTWVKIPKAFAGIWQTRNEKVNGGIQDNLKITENNNQPLTQKNSLSQANVLLGLLNTYIFIRGFQIDNEGNIWDCPNLRNVQYHYLEIFGMQIPKIYYISNRKIIDISNDRLVEDLTRTSLSGNMELNINMHVVKNLISPNKINALYEFILVNSDPKSIGEKLIIPEYKMADFLPIDVFYGINLKDSLNTFLKSQTSN